MFSKNKRNPDGHCSRCKLCHKKYYEKNKDKWKAKNAAYYRENRDKAIAASSAYHRENKDKALIANRAWRQRNKETINAHRRDWRTQRRGTIDYALRCLLDSARSRAKAKELPFDLTMEWLEVMIISHCPITLQPIDWLKEQVVNGTASPNSPSIDRIIPKLGYAQSNCAIISHRGNTIKNSGTIDEHCRTIQYMAAQQLRDTEF